MKIGIVGNGYVGKATALLKKESLYEVHLFTEDWLEEHFLIDERDVETTKNNLDKNGNGNVTFAEGVEVLIWDTDKEKRNIKRFEDLSGCDLVFVCVPTPMNEDGSCHTEIVENVVYDLIGLEIKMRDIIVRSTVPVGTCERLGVSFMPEFLTEANWKEDFKNNKDWIFGFDPPNCCEPDNFLKLAKMWDKNVEILTTKEAELSKYTRNAFLATKVSFFNEIEELCRKLNISYEHVKMGVCLDNRIGFSHTQVPGPDGKRGFGGTCFPKDIASLDHQMTQHGVESYIVEGAKARNLQVDRAEKDWESNKGRAVI